MPDFNKNRSNKNKPYRDGGRRDHSDAPRRRYDRPERSDDRRRPDSRGFGGNGFDSDDEDMSTDYIIGRNPVTEALKAGKTLNCIYINSEAGGSISVIVKMAKEKGILVKKTDDRKLSAMSDGASHQGVIAVGACAEYSTVEDILAVSEKKGRPPFIIICDEIEDPHNLGAIIRTAETSGADGVIIPKRRSAALNHTVFKTSAGAASYVPVARVANLPACIDELKEKGIWIYGTDGSGEDYASTDLTGPCALIVGSEGFGMGRLVKEKCDFLLKLPMYGEITSLNASVAAGIFMYEAVRQRRIKKIM